MTTRPRNIQNWKQFELTMSDPPSYKGHFNLIKKRLIPFVNKNRVRFWVTNYFGPTRDFVLFRVKASERKLKLTRKLLQELKDQKEIIRWREDKWDPKKDAETRIVSASKKLGLPPNIALGVRGPYMLSQEIVFEKRVEQLEAIYTKAVGPCTKVLYKALKSKPTDPWMISLFIHLILNSLDIAGPNPPREECSIRHMPVY